MCRKNVRERHHNYRQYYRRNHRALGADLDISLDRENPDPDNGQGKCRGPGHGSIHRQLSRASPQEKPAKRKAPSFIDAVPGWAFILTNVVILSVSGIVLGTGFGIFFIGVSWKLKMWPGMAALIVASLVGMSLYMKWHA